MCVVKALCSDRFVPADKVGMRAGNMSGNCRLWQRSVSGEPHSPVVNVAPNNDVNTSLNTGQEPVKYGRMFDQVC